jgi:hypothetical protein
MKRSRVIAPQDGPIEATTERTERDLSPTSELLAAGGADPEQLAQGEERLRQAEGSAGPRFRSGTAVQNIGRTAREALDTGDPVGGALGATVEAPFFLAGGAAQATAAAQTGEIPDVEDATDALDASIGGQATAAKEQPIETALTLAAPVAAGKVAGGAAPKTTGRVRSAVSDKPLGFEQKLKSRSKTGRSRSADLESLPDDIAGTEPRPGATRSRPETASGQRSVGQRSAAEQSSRRRAAAERSVERPESVVEQAMRTDQSVGELLATEPQPGTAGAPTGVAAGAATTAGAAERQAAAEEPAVRVDDALDTETQQTQPRSEPTQRQDELQALDEAARERQVSIEAAADTSLEGIDSRNATRDRQRDRAATATTASIAERARATQSPTQSTPTDTTPTQPSTDTPQLPRAVRGGGDGDDDDSDDEMSFTLLAQENLFPARDPITGPGNVLEEAGFE